MAAAVILLVVTAAADVSDRSSTPVAACGPFIDFQVFTRTREPDLPSFLGGQLGVIQPTYRPRYLVAAWRTLRGKPLTSVEQDAYAGDSPPAPQRSALDVWLDARRSVATLQPLAERPEPQALLTGQNVYAYIVNCGDDAFATAAETLTKRHKRWGEGAALAEWVAAQDTVFANCGRRARVTPSIPPELPATEPADRRADRAYQIAAARFYAGQFAEAEAAFNAIAQDRDSPWATLAPYLAARAMVRQGTVGGADAQGDPASLRRAQTVLDAILRDPTRQPIHEAARGLRQFVRVRLQPAEVLHDVAGRLADPAHAAEFADRLADFDYLTNSSRDAALELATLPSAAGDGGEMLAWIAAAEGRSVAGIDSIARWQATRATPWLMVALMAAAPDDARIEGLLADAAAVTDRGPEFPTIAFHRARLLLRRGDVATARSVLADVLDTPGLPPSSRNLVKAARLLTARTLEQFLEDAVRSAIDEGGEVAGTVPAGEPDASQVFDLDVLAIVNERLPLDVLRTIAASPAVPPAVRRELTQAIFVRALLLDRLDVVRELAMDLARQETELRTALRRLVTGDDQRLRDEAALLLLRAPGLRPYVPAWSFRDNRRQLPWTEGLTGFSALRDNWWCGFEPSPGSYYTPHLRRVGPFSDIQANLHSDASVPTPAFMTTEQRQAAASERASLERLDSGSNEIARRVLEWAKRNPRDPRVPEALHRVVRGIRVGCNNERTGALSRAAFMLLHSRYGKTSWAAKTPYWYK